MTQLVDILSFAKTPAQRAILIHVTCYTASLYVIDFTRALNSGEAHPSGLPPEQLLQPRPSSSESPWLPKAPHASLAVRDASKPLCLPRKPSELEPSRCSPCSASSTSSL